MAFSKSVRQSYTRSTAEDVLTVAALNAEKYLLLIKDEDGSRVVIAGVSLREAERAYIEGFPWVM